FACDRTARDGHSDATVIVAAGTTFAAYDDQSRPMAERFIEEQIRRLRELSERFTRVHGEAAELTRELERDRAASGVRPLHDVRDLRSRVSNDEPAENHAARRARGSRRRRR